MTQTRGPPLRLVLGGGLALSLLCLGLFGWLGAQIHPEPAAAGLRHRRAPAGARSLGASPSGRSEPGCLVQVTVTGEQGPLAEAELRVGEHPSALGEPLSTDASGRASSVVPCGPVHLVAEADGYAPASDLIIVDVGEAQEIVIALRRGRLVVGTVSDPAGHPIAAASVLSGASTSETETDGAYTIVVPYDPSALLVSALGYDEAVVELAAVPTDSTEPTTVDVTLEPNHDVAVWCLGMPGDICPDMPLFCTSPWLLTGEECNRRERWPLEPLTLCSCPDGEVAVRGGGASVLVPADAHEAWLDLEDAGSVSGRIVSKTSELSRCSVELIRIPEALEDLPRGVLVAQRVDCAEDGAFRAEGVVAGDWELHVEGSLLPSGERKERTLPPLRVGPGADVDVGAVTHEGGGSVAGLLVDGLTGQPLPYQPVVGVRWSAGAERSAVLGGQSDEVGQFRIEGMPPGTWSLSHILAPQDAIEVEVREGELTDGLRLETSDATALDVNGFALSEEEGQLVVADVEEGSPADLAGLEAGEVVVGVRLAGLDLGSSFGGKGALINRFVLGHWDGPGVTLVVRGEDGEEELVPLDW